MPTDVGSQEREGLRLLLAADQSDILALKVNTAWILVDTADGSYAIWRHTGNVYRAFHEAVEEDPWITVTPLEQWCA